MNRGFGFLIFLLLFWTTGTGQYTITGIIRDSSTSKPVAYATISIIDTGKTPIAASYSLENGSFKTIVPRSGVFSCEISFIGYKTRVLPLTISKDLDLGSIFIAPGGDHLREVTVTSRKRLVDQKPGMLVYNAENDLTNKGGTAADVLRKAPILSVDAQGNVSMRGSSNLKILINGKYSGQMARSAADALNMMPAALIKSVEIITTPSAKYDAEGAAGVINIITKKGKGDLSGTLEASVSNLEQMLNPRFSLSKQKWNINFTGHLHRLRSKSAQILNRSSFSDNDTTLIKQFIEKDNAAPHGSADLTIDYEMDEKSELSLAVNAWVGKWPDNNLMNSTVYKPDGAITEQYQQDITKSANYLGMDASLSYNRRMKRPGQQISLLFQSSPSRDISRYDALQPTYRELNDSKTKNREFTFQSDYVHPLDAKGMVHLETGAKLILRKVGSRYDVLAGDPSQSEILVPLPDRSDNFQYRQDVLAGYSILRANMKNDWYVEAGARVEATYIKGNFTHSGFDNQFVNFVPTATLTKKIDANNTLNLSYTKRLTRPYIWDLNPNANSSDPKNIETGNPDLNPEMSHQVELSHSLNAGQTFFLNTAVFWKQTDNAIIEFMETNAEGVSFTTKQNLASNKQFGMNLSATAHLSQQWMVNGNANVNYFDFSSSALNIQRRGWGTEVNLNSTYKLPNDFSVQAFGEYKTDMVTLLGTRGSIYYYSFAGKKEIKKARMSVTLAMINPFAEYVERTDLTERINFSSAVDNRYFNRAFKLTVNWEFGGLQKEGRDRKKIENNDINVQGKG